MAKFMPLPSLQQMEQELGHSALSMTQHSAATDRFYTNLKPVPSDNWKQFMKEYEELKNATQRNRDLGNSELILPRLGENFVIDGGDVKVIIAQMDRVGFFRISVDIIINSGFSLALLFSEAEAWRIMSISKLRSDRSSNEPSPFFNLPQEIREKIYRFSLPHRELSIKNVQYFNQYSFPTAIGDPTGFLFQLGEEPTVLQISRRMRQEALSLAYRRTSFCLDDMDDMMKLLVAVGQIGRDNITSLQFPWASKSEIAWRWEEYPQADDNDMKLPELHVLKCVQLLKLCKRLELLRISFDRELLENTSEHQFITDPGIAGLCTLEGIQTIEIVDHTDEPLEQHRLVKQLRQQMQKTMDGGGAYNVR